MIAPACLSLPRRWSSRMDRSLRPVFFAVYVVVNGPFPAGAQFDGGDVLDVGPTVLERTYSSRRY
jgi:hypothetical protein